MLSDSSNFASKNIILLNLYTTNSSNLSSALSRIKDGKVFKKLDNNIDMAKTLEDLQKQNEKGLHSATLRAVNKGFFEEVYTDQSTWGLKTGTNSLWMIADSNFSTKLQSLAEEIYFWMKEIVILLRVLLNEDININLFVKESDAQLYRMLYQNINLGYNHGRDFFSKHRNRGNLSVPPKLAPPPKYGFSFSNDFKMAESAFTIVEHLLSVSFNKEFSAVLQNFTMAGHAKNLFLKYLSYYITLEGLIKNWYKHFYSTDKIQRVALKKMFESYRQKRVPNNFSEDLDKVLNNISQNFQDYSKIRNSLAHQFEVQCDYKKFQECLNNLINAVYIILRYEIYASLSDKSEWNSISRNSDISSYFTTPSSHQYSLDIASLNYSWLLGSKWKGNCVFNREGECFEFDEFVLKLNLNFENPLLYLGDLTLKKKSKKFAYSFMPLAHDLTGQSRLDSKGSFHSHLIPFTIVETEREGVKLKVVAHHMLENIESDAKSSGSYVKCVSGLENITQVYIERISL